MIHLLIYNSANDYVNTARLCEDAIAFFDKKAYDSGLPLQVFYYNLIVLLASDSRSSTRAKKW